MGMWVGIERGLTAIRERDERAAARQAEQDRFDQQMGLKREMFEQDVAQWQAEHKLKVLGAIGASGATRRTTPAGSSGAGTQGVTQDYVVKRALALGVDEELLAKDIAEYGLDGANSRLDAAEKYNEAYKNTPDQMNINEFYRNVPMALLEAGSETNLNEVLESLGYESGYLEEYIGDGIVTTPNLYGAIETPFEDPMSPDRRKKIGDEQVRAATAGINSIIANLSEGDNRAGPLKEALSNTDGTGIPRALRLLTEEEKATIWNDVTEVHSGFISPALRGFEPEAKPEPTPTPSTGFMSRPDTFVPLTSEAPEPVETPPPAAPVPEVKDLAVETEEKDPLQPVAYDPPEGPELPAVGKIGDTMYFQDMSAYYDWLVNNPVHDLKKGDKVMVGTQVFTIDEEFQRHFP